MPFGIIDTSLEDSDGFLPGTELLIGNRGVASDVGRRRTNLKQAIHRGVETVLVPQPSENDLNDPLLWPSWQKEAAFWVLFVNTIIFGILPGPIIAPATIALAPILNVDLTHVAQLSGYHNLVVGGLGPLVSVLAKKYGKRPQFLFASAAGTLGTVICIVGSHQSNYQTLLAGRMIQGLGVTGWESLSLAAVGDMFYLHERGWRTAVIVCSLACMASTVSIISGVMFQNHGYRNLFIAQLPFDAVGLAATVFLVPETQFIRPTSLRATEFMARGDTDKDEKERTENVETIHAHAPEAQLIPRKSFLSFLAPWTGVTYTHTSVPSLLAGIFIHLANPATLWIQMVSAVLVALFVVSAYILSQIWSVPPYNLDVAENGYFYSGALVGGTLAVIVGPICDWSARRLSALNKGVFEAEFHIPVNILGTLFCGLGWFGFMWTVDHPRPNGYFLGAFFHGCVCFGISVPSTSAGLYILNCFPKQSTEVFVLQMMLKNFIFYAFSNSINTWTATEGAGEVFKVFGIVSLSVLATCIPMYIFGKVNRKFMFGLYTRNRFFRSLS